MKYTQEEKVKMDAIAEAFRSYVNQRDDYDVIWSPKAGYLRLLTGESCDRIYFPIDGASDMLRMFIEDHLMDEEERADFCPEPDYAHARSLLIPRLDALGEYREEAFEIMEKTMDDCRCSDLIHQFHLQEEREPEETHKHLRAGI